ncbi:MAG: hypothetical protein VXW87_01530 [Pseudomonadota bacterium]|nr:hypothetical protein [Pseudomonadota bacterium]
MSYVNLASQVYNNVDGDLKRFGSTKKVIEKDTLSDDEKVSAGKLYSELLGLIKRDAIAIIDTNAKIDANMKVFLTQYAQSGCNSDAVRGLGGSGVTLFGATSDSKWSEAYDEGSKDLETANTPGKKSIEKLQTRMAHLAGFAAAIHAKINGETVKDKDCVVSGDDAIIEDILATNDVVAKADYDIAEDGVLKGLFPRVGLCGRLVATKDSEKKDSEKKDSEKKENKKGSETTENQEGGSKENDGSTGTGPTEPASPPAQGNAASSQSDTPGPVPPIAPPSQAGNGDSEPPVEPSDSESSQHSNS